MCKFLGPNSLSLVVRGVPLIWYRLEAFTWSLLARDLPVTDSEGEGWSERLPLPCEDSLGSGSLYWYSFGIQEPHLHVPLGALCAQGGGVDG